MVLRNVGSVDQVAVDADPGDDYAFRYAEMAVNRQAVDLAQLLILAPDPVLGPVLEPLQLTPALWLLAPSVDRLISTHQISHASTSLPNRCALSGRNPTDSCRSERTAQSFGVLTPSQTSHWLTFSTQRRILILASSVARRISSTIPLSVL